VLEYEGDAVRHVHFPQTFLAIAMAASAAAGEVGPDAPLVIPIRDAIGGTGVSNNAKNNPNGGYFSIFDSIDEFNYPNTHGNQLGKTAMVNDHAYWDGEGLKHTHVPAPDRGGGGVLWWPVPTEWAAYEVIVAAQDTYTVLTRFSSSWGPEKPVVIHMEMDGVSSGPIVLKPDDPELWKDKKYQVGGWWGHTMVSCTSPKGWRLAAGRHVLKVCIDSFPEKPKDHGNLWIHYFKVLKGGTPVVMPTASLAGQKETATVAAAKLATAKVMEACDYTPLDADQVLATLKRNIEAATKMGKRIEVWLTIFGQRQKVELAQADEQGVGVMVARNLFSQPWSKLSGDEVAEIARSCILTDGGKAMDLADYYIATGQHAKAGEALTMAATVDSRLGKPLIDRIKYLDALAAAKAPAPKTPATTKHVLLP